MANYHVSGNRKTGYPVKRENASRISGRYSTQHEAEEKAKELSHNTGGGEVRIHSIHGPIRDSDTVKPKNDPCPPKDNKH